MTREEFTARVLMLGVQLIWDKEISLGNNSSRYYVSLRPISDMGVAVIHSNILRLNHPKRLWGAGVPVHTFEDALQIMSETVQGNI